MSSRYVGRGQGFRNHCCPRQQSWAAAVARPSLHQKMAPLSNRQSLHSEISSHKSHWLLIWLVHPCWAACWFRQRKEMLPKENCQKCSLFIQNLTCVLVRQQPISVVLVNSIQHCSVISFMLLSTFGSLLCPCSHILTTADIILPCPFHSEISLEAVKKHTKTTFLNTVNFYDMLNVKCCNMLFYNLFLFYDPCYKVILPCLNFIKLL